jgi:nitrite reductase (NO-forming)
VLLAVLAGAAAQRFAEPGATLAAAMVPTGHTTTVTVTADAMRYRPDHIAVPAGDRLFIELTNNDGRRHDLVLSTGGRTPLLDKGGSARLDAGVIGGTVHGWCSQPAHRASGMTLTITAAGGDASGSGAGGDDAMLGMDNPPAAPSTMDTMAEPAPGFVARDTTLARAPAEHLHRITLHATAQRDIAPGLSQTLWTFGGTAPGPVLRGRSATCSR